MDSGTYSWGHASFPLENMSHLGHPTYGITIAANPTSDTGSFLPRDSLAVDEPWVPARAHPSISATYIQERAGTLHPEDTIANIHDEDSSMAHFLDPIFWSGFSSSLTQMPQKSTEVLELPLIISNDSLTYVDCGYKDTTHEEVESINIPSDEGNQYSQYDTAYSTSESSIHSGISRVPAIVKYQEQRISRAQHRQLHKSGKRKKHAASSSQSARRPTSAYGLGARNGPYSCDICGKAYAQRQGLGRHRREAHDAQSCKYCGTFRWGRPYVFKKHIRERHPEVNLDAALKEAMGAGRGFPSVTRYPSPLQRDIPPEHDRRTCVEFQPHPFAPLHQVANIAPPSVHPLCPVYLNANVPVTKQDDFKCPVLLLPERVRPQESMSNWQNTRTYILIPDKFGCSSFGTNSSWSAEVDTLLSTPMMSSDVITPVSVSTATHFLTADAVQRTGPDPAVD